MTRLSRTLRVSGVVLLAVAGAGSGVVSADAVELPDAVTEVNIEQETAATWSQLKLHLAWEVPDGTRGGDTFSLELPEQLVATDGTTFPLRDESGLTVATAVVDGSTVTFTMTDYAETHVGVHGTAWFWVRFTDVVQPGEDVDLLFRVGDTTFVDTVTVAAPGPGNPDYPTKWQTWVQGVPNRLLWAVDGPVVRDTMVNSTYEIVDTAGPGQEIDCDDVHLFTGTRDGDFVETGYVPRTLVESFECSPAQVRVVVKPTTNQVGQAFRLLGESAVTDTTLSEYRNSGYVRLWDTVELPVSHVIQAGAGGDGTGVVPTPTEVPTSPSPTTTVPGSPTPTGTPTSPNPTVTVPVSPTPTETPTSPAPTTTVPGSPTAGPTSPVPTVTVTAPAPAPTVVVTVGGPTVDITNNPTLAPGSPAPTVTVPGSPTGDDTPTLNPGAATPTPDDTVTVTTSPTPLAPAAPTTTVASTPLAPAAPVRVVRASGPQQVVQASPRRIDTGVPEEGLDPRLAGAGAALALFSGVGLIAVSRRRPQTDEA